MRTRTRILAALAAIATVGTVGTAVTPAAANERPDIMGSVESWSGAKLAGVEIQALVEPDAQTINDMPAGTTSLPRVVGSAVTNAAGVFQLKITDEAAVASAGDSDGLVSVILTGQTPEGQVYFRTRMTPREQGGFVAYQPDVDGDTGAENVAQLRKEGRENRQSRTTGVTNGIPQLRLTPLPAAKTTAPGSVTTLGFDPNAWCSGNYWWYKKVEGTSGRNVTLMNQATASKTTGKFTYTSSVETSLEASVTTSGSFAASVGMMKGTTTAMTISLPSPASTNAEWYVGFEFNLYDIWCGSPTGAQWWSQYTEYRPWRPDGGASRRTWTPFTCNTANQSTLGPGAEVKVAKDQTVTKTGSFTTGGVSMKAQQKWTSSAAVEYKAINATTSYGLCGDGAKYPYAVSRTRQT
ncbi:hypothetical protein AB0B31_23395 [Catellatospora citrea]|uniref:hypothetical protein n=1 Tax=Catellatospora citrea TaxID=53366 RepID=UPI0033E08CA4